MVSNQFGKATMRIILVMILIVAVILAYFLLSSPPKPAGSSHSGAPLVDQNKLSEQASTPLQIPTDVHLIQSVKFQPDQPTSQDTLTAQVVPASGNKAIASLEYSWMVNGNPLADAQGSSLPPKFFKKGDRVCVIVIPIVNGNKGFPSERACAVIVGASPMLELKALPHGTDGTAQMQLVGVVPDGGALTYELEPPVPEGLSIDKKTGVLRWNPSKKEKGVIQFKASATTTDRVKTVKMFEFNVEVK